MSTFDHLPSPPPDPPTLRTVDPELYHLSTRLVRRYPALRRAAWRAALLVWANKVQAPLPHSTALAEVRSATEAAVTYALTWEDDSLCCTCPSWKENAPLGPRGTPLCKHLLAYVLVMRLDRPLAPALTAPALWRAVRRELRNRLLPETWGLLWEDMRLDRAKSTPVQLQLTTPNPLVAQWLSKPRWRQPVERMAGELAGRRVTVVTAHGIVPHAETARPDVPGPTHYGMVIVSRTPRPSYDERQVSHDP